MADGFPITPGAGGLVATDDCGAAGHVQLVKLAVGTDGSAALLPGNAANGLDVRVTSLPATTQNVNVTSLPAGTRDVRVIQSAPLDVNVTALPTGTRDVRVIQSAPLDVKVIQAAPIDVTAPTPLDVKVTQTAPIDVKLPATPLDVKVTQTAPIDVNVTSQPSTAAGTYAYAAGTVPTTVDVPANGRVRRVSVLAGTTAVGITIAGGPTITVPAGSAFDDQLIGDAALGGDVVITGGVVSYYVSWTT